MANIPGYRLERVAYEIRYPSAFALWDSAGAIANALLALAPEAQSLDAQPNRITFRLDDKHEVVVELSQARIVSFFPSGSLEKTAALSQGVFSCILSALRPKVLDRVGARFMYYKKFPNEADASAHLMTLNWLTVPASLLGHSSKNDASKAEMPDIAFRVVSTHLGTLFRIRSEERKLEINPTLDMRHILDARTEIENGVALDVDHYTKTPILLSQIHFSDWLLQASRVAARDGERLSTGMKARNHE